MSNLNLKPPANLLHRPATSTQKLDYGVMVHNLIEEIFNCGLTIGMSAQETHEFVTEELRERASKHGVLFPDVHIVPPPIGVDFNYPPSIIHVYTMGENVDVSALTKKQICERINDDRIIVDGFTADPEQDPDGPLILDPIHHEPNIVITETDGEGNERSYCPVDPVPLKFEPHPEPHQTE